MESEEGRQPHLLRTNVARGQKSLQMLRGDRKTFAILRCGPDAVVARASGPDVGSALFDRGQQFRCCHQWANAVRVVFVKNIPL